VLRRTWHSGDTVVVSLPMELREEVLPGDRNTVAALFGPLVLAANLGNGPTTGETKIITGRGTAPGGVSAPSPSPVAKSGSKQAAWVEPVAGSNLRFRAAQTNGESLDVLPIYQIRDQRYSVYWDRARG